MRPSASHPSAPPNAPPGRPVGDRLWRWLAGTGRAEMPEVRRAMLLTLREPEHVTLLAFFWTQAVAIAAWWLAGARWALGWVAVDTLFFALRIAASRRIGRAETRGERLPARPVFALHAAWIATIALGTALTVSQVDLRLVVLGTVLPIGYCGYVVSRWQAFPRCAMTFIVMLWLGLFAGLLASPLPTVPDIAWLVPAGGLAFHVLLGLNHAIILGALRAQQENRRLSMHDPLTELPNRLTLRERLAAAIRAEAPFAVLCLDLDGFKAVNDRHGHAAGDWLLKSVAERLRQALRAQDLVCRVGGDEFVVLLPGAGAQDAVEIALRLLAAMERPHDLGGLSGVRCGTSIGIALAPADGLDADRLLRVADDRMYAAKRAGRAAGRSTWRLRDEPAAA